MPPSETTLDADSRRRVRDALRRLRTRDQAREAFSRSTTPNINASAGPAATPASETSMPSGLSGDLLNISAVQQNEPRSLREGNAMLLERNRALRQLVDMPLNTERSQTQSSELDSEPSSPRRKRRRIMREAPDSEENFACIQYGYEGQVVPGRLNMQLVSSDGGVYEPHAASKPTGRSQGPECVLNDETSVYCTKNARCNMIFQHQAETPFTLEKLVVKAPRTGFTDPVQEGLVFMSMEMDDVFERTAQYQVSHLKTSRFGSYCEKMRKRRKRPSENVRSSDRGLSNINCDMRATVRISYGDEPASQEYASDDTASSGYEDDVVTDESLERASADSAHHGTRDNVLEQFDFEEFYDRGHETFADHRERATSRSQGHAEKSASRSPGHDATADVATHANADSPQLLKPLAHFDLSPSCSPAVSRPFFDLVSGPSRNTAMSLGNRQRQWIYPYPHELSTSISRDGALRGGTGSSRPTLRRNATVRHNAPIVPAGVAQTRLPQLSDVVSQNESWPTATSAEARQNSQLVQLGQLAADASSRRLVQMIELATDPDQLIHPSYLEDYSENGIELAQSALDQARTQYAIRDNESSEAYRRRLVRHAGRMLSRIETRAVTEQQAMDRGFFRRDFGNGLLVGFLEREMHNRGFSEGHPREFYSTPEPEDIQQRLRNGDGYPMDNPIERTLPLHTREASAVRSAIITRGIETDHSLSGASSALEQLVAMPVRTEEQSQQIFDHAMRRSAEGRNPNTQFANRFTVDRCICLTNSEFSSLMAEAQQLALSSISRTTPAQASTFPQFFFFAQDEFLRRRYFARLSEIQQERRRVLRAGAAQEARIPHTTGWEARHARIAGPPRPQMDFGEGTPEFEAMWQEGSASFARDLAAANVAQGARANANPAAPPHRQTTTGPNTSGTENPNTSDLIALGQRTLYTDPVFAPPGHQTLAQSDRVFTRTGRSRVLDIARNMDPMLESRAHMRAAQTHLASLRRREAELAARLDNLTAGSDVGGQPRQGKTVTITFDPPVSGRYLLLKLWNPRATGEAGEGNIDLESVQCWGFSGRRWFPALEIR